MQYSGQLISTAIWLRVRRPAVGFSVGKVILLFCIYKPALGPTLLPIHRVLGLLPGNRAASA
jgi:hypothetical protein